jgi:hypothetical protein
MENLEDNIDEEIIEENKNSYKDKKMKEWSYEDAGNWILDNCKEMKIKLIINEKEEDPKKIFVTNEIDGKVLLLFKDESKFEKYGFKSGSALKLYEALKILQGK